MQRGILAVAISVLMAAAPVAAQKPKGGQPKAHVTSKTVVKTQPSAHGKSTVKVQTRSSVKPVKVKPVKTTSGTKASKPTVKTSKTTTKSARTTTTTTTTTPTTPTGTLSPVQQKLERNTNLAAKLRTRLPAGTDLMTAAAGFKNLGQFVSTVNASYNHQLSFEGLKQRILDEHMSLGQAMKDMR